MMNNNQRDPRNELFNEILTPNQIMNASFNLDRIEETRENLHNPTPGITFLYGLVALFGVGVLVVTGIWVLLSCIL